jgi:hypothetical protein
MIWTFICGDLEKTINFPHLLTPGFMVVLLCSCVLAFVLNYCIFLNTTLNSALTQTICGNMKVGFTLLVSPVQKKNVKLICQGETLNIISSLQDLFTVGLGWMLFGGLPFDLVIFFNIPIIPLNLKSASTFATSHYLSFLVHLHRWMWLDSFLVSSGQVYMHIIRSSGGNKSKTKKSQRKHEWPSDDKGSLV